MLVFDLDPGAPAGIVECCEVARVLHGLFEQLGLESFAKTSGSKGLQVYVPLNIERRATRRPSRSPGGSPSCSSSGCRSSSSRG